MSGRTTCSRFSLTRNDHNWEGTYLVLPNILLAKGILRIKLLIRKHSGSVMSTAMPHLSSG